jgi:hypothetical protein
MEMTVFQKSLSRGGSNISAPKRGIGPTSRLNDSISSAMSLLESLVLNMDKSKLF